MAMATEDQKASKSAGKPKSIAGVFKAGLMTGAVTGVLGPHLLSWLGKRALIRIRRAAPRRLKQANSALAKEAPKQPEVFDAAKKAAAQPLAPKVAEPAALAAVIASTAPPKEAAKAAPGPSALTAATNPAAALNKEKDVAPPSRKTALVQALKGAKSSALTKLEGRRGIQLAAASVAVTAVAAGAVLVSQRLLRRKASDKAPSSGKSPQPTGAAADTTTDITTAATTAAVDVAASAPPKAATPVTTPKVGAESAATTTEAGATAQVATAASGVGDTPTLEDQVGGALNLVFSRLGLNLRATPKNA